ncbi:hypothetical protein OS493_036468 [Desmophyllum pertusum]|uniref:Uncharacterized protein n=1 Tax=Desmophyllum pertusum TaxID=174260 RepID=A0A9X0CCN1_9CNID|nr:hypothetical protein OS493_036468 [Desmophyllum pertusum]
MAESEGQTSPMRIKSLSVNDLILYQVGSESGVGALWASTRMTTNDDSAEPINALRPGYSERGNLVQQDTGTSGSHSPVCGIQYQPEDIQNALRPGYSERGNLVQQDTGTSGSHSPVCGSRYQPDDIQDEAGIQAEL